MSRVSGFGFRVLGFRGKPQTLRFRVTAAWGALTFIDSVLETQELWGDAWRGPSCLWYRADISNRGFELRLWRAQTLRLHVPI